MKCKKDDLFVDLIHEDVYKIEKISYDRNWITLIDICTEQELKLHKTVFYDNFVPYLPNGDE